MADKLFTTEEQKEYEALARKRGFESLRDYLIAFIERDLEVHDKNEDDDDLGDPLENFKIAWDQAMRGDLITLEEFRRSMEEDDD